MVSTNNSRGRDRLPRRFLGRLRRLPAPVWTLATIFGVAGLMCLFAAAFPISKTAPRELATIVGACLIVASLVLLRFGARLPQVGLQGLAIGGTLINALLVSHATTSYGATLNSMAWIWVAIYAGQFFEFALLFVADGDAAVDVLGRLREAAPVGWSAGVVEWRPGESLERAMARADEDLYRAKREARDEIAPLAIIGEWPPA